MKEIYMCRPEFENGRLRERSRTENGGGSFQSDTSLKKVGDFGAKTNKETYFLKRGSFGAAQVGKVE